MFSVVSALLYTLLICQFGCTEEGTLPGYEGEQSEAPFRYITSESSDTTAVPEVDSEEDTGLDATDDSGNETEEPYISPNLMSMKITTWNLENFSPAGSNSDRLQTIAGILKSLDSDIVLLQELLEGNTEAPAIEALNAQMGETQFVRGEWEDYDSTVGLLYRKSRFNLVESKSLFSPNWYAFPRPPLFVVLEDRESDNAEIALIVIHLKSYEEDGSDLPRRQEAMGILNTFVQAQKNPLILMGGDFNDNPFDVPESNIFSPIFLGSDSTYSFLTYTLGSDAYTFAGFIDGVWKGLFLDHLIATSEFREAAGEPKTEIYPVGLFEMDSWNDSHSDHLPVTVTFSGTAN